MRNEYYSLKKINKLNALYNLIIGQRFCLLCLADHIADARQQAHQYDQVKAEAFHFAFQIGLTPLP